MAASVEELLGALSGREEPIEELRSLKTAVLALPLSVLTGTTPTLRLQPVFSLMSSPNREQVELCVAILERLLQALSPVHVSRHYKEELQRGLHHPQDAARLLAIAQVGRMVECSEAVADIMEDVELLRQVIRCIGGASIAVAKQAIQTLSRLAHTSPTLTALCHTSLLADLRAVMAVSDTVRYRVYELEVELSSVSPDSLALCDRGGILSQLLAEISGDDLLLRVTCTEMVTALARTLHGRQYLAQQGIIDSMSSLIEGAESDPFSAFYLPGLVKFFGNLAVLQSPQQVCEHYPAFLERVFAVMEGRETTMIGVAVDTLGLLGSTVEGKQVLHKTGTRFSHVLRRMGEHARNAPTELRVRCLDALCSLLHLPPGEHNDDLLAMTEAWCSELSSQPIEMLRTIARQPFPELHCASLRLLAAVANQPWAQKLMIGTPGFVEYVVDRTVDPDKDSKDAKYELVKCLVRSGTAAEVFGSQHYLRLRTYLREGPYYVKATSAVAVEGAE